MDRARTFFWIYILQILLFLRLYFLSISLGGDTYHTPPHKPSPWHWWIAPGPSPQRHRPISHGHTQTVGRQPVSQPAQTWPGGPGLFRAQQTLSFPSHALLHPSVWNYMGLQTCAVKSGADATAQTQDNPLITELCHNCTTQPHPKVALLPSSSSLFFLARIEDRIR